MQSVINTSVVNLSANTERLELLDLSQYVLDNQTALWRLLIGDCNVIVGCIKENPLLYSLRHVAAYLF